jgi:hypothetical protein
VLRLPLTVPTPTSAEHPADEPTAAGSREPVHR